MRRSGWALVVRERFGSFPIRAVAGSPLVVGAGGAFFFAGHDPFLSRRRSVPHRDRGQVSSILPAIAPSAMAILRQGGSEIRPSRTW